MGGSAIFMPVTRCRYVYRMYIGWYLGCADWHFFPPFQVKDRHLNPKAACLQKREEEKAARIGSCSTPVPITPTGSDSAQSGFDFDTSGLTNDSLPLTSIPLSNGTSGGNGSLSPANYYSTAGEFQSTSPASSFPYSIPYNPSPPPLASSSSSSDKIPRVRSDPIMKRKTNGNISPTLKMAKGGGRLLLSSTRNEPKQEWINQYLMGWRGCGGYCFLSYGVFVCIFLYIFWNFWLALWSHDHLH